MFVVVGLLVHSVVSTVLSAQFRDAFDFHGEFVGRVVVGPLLAGDDLSSMTPLLLQQHVAVDDQVVGIQLVRRGIVIAASDRETIGLSPASDLAPGLVATTTPFGEDGDAVVHVIQDFAPSEAARRDLVRTLDLILGLGLLGLWLVLLPMVVRLGRGLRARSDELEQQRGELRRLLANEQQAVGELEELGRLRDSFLSAVSHELRTPLTVVKGILLALQHQRAMVTTEQREQLIERAGRSAERLDTLLEELLELNRVTDRHDDVVCATLDVAACVEEVVSHLPPRRVTLELDAPTLVADRLQVETILGNLIGNAHRHAPATTDLLVRTSRRDGAVDLCVADRGPGVPDRLKEEIFLPFRQGDIIDKHAPGTGIGLALVARFAKHHGGRAWVTDRDGGGAEFHVRFPQPSVADEATERQPVVSGAVGS